MPDDAYERYEISFAPMRVPLAEIPIAIANRIAREKRAELAAVHPGFPSFLRLTVRVAGTTFDAMKYLCATAPPDPSRRVEFAICIPPLARTILDTLFTLILIFDDPAKNLRWYFAAGWRDELEHTQALAEKHRGDPAWAEWIERYRERLDHLERDAGITDAERESPSKIRYWPHPGRILSDQRKNGPAAMSSQERRAFLEFLDDWHYGKLSGDSHLSPFGLVRRGWMLTERKDRDAAWDDLTSLYRSQQFINATTLYLALLSELVVELDLDHEKTRVASLWSHILRWPEAQELLDQRYAKLLGLSASRPEAG